MKSLRVGIQASPLICSVNRLLTGVGFGDKVHATLLKYSCLALSMTADPL